MVNLRCTGSAGETGSADVTKEEEDTAVHVAVAFDEDDSKLADRPATANDDFEASFIDMVEEPSIIVALAKPPPPPPLLLQQHHHHSHPVELPPPPKITSSFIKKKSFACAQCSSKFYTADGLEAHERLHSGQKPFVCPICRVGISSKDHLDVHMRIHTGQKPFACHLCEKAFADKTSYRRHAATSHSAAEGRERPSSLRCQHCKRDYADLSTLRRHQKEKHPKEKGSADVGRRFVCGICKKEFFRRAIVAVHVGKVHKIEKEDERQKYISEKQVEEADGAPKKKNSGRGVDCPQCDMVFYKQSTMEIHLRKHTGDKPYVCEVCGKKFARSNNLKLHTRTHTGERPYVCAVEDCARAFSDVSALR
jgi:KRAB domain-containing zinc finger protein